MLKSLGNRDPKQTIEQIQLDLANSLLNPVRAMSKSSSFRVARNPTTETTQKTQQTARLVTL